MTNESDGRETRRRGANPQTTIHDVARLAKVSIGTVSKALNRGGRLKPETRERVIAAAKQLVAERPSGTRGHAFFDFSLPRPDAPDMAMSLRTDAMLGSYIARGISRP